MDFEDQLVIVSCGHRKWLYLNVVLTQEVKNNVLPTKLKHRIEQFVTSLSKLYVAKGEYTRLQKLRNAFAETYGSNTIVDFTEVIDPNGFNGLSLYENRNLNEFSRREKEIERVFHEAIQWALFAGEDVRLYEEDFSTVLDSNSCDLDDCQVSFDINLFVTRHCGQYFLTLGPNMGSAKCGNTVQRFICALSTQSDLIQSYKDLYFREKQIYGADSMIVEIKQMSIRGRLMNISNNNQEVDHYLPLGYAGKSDCTVSINDLGLYLDEERELHIVYKPTGQKCIIVSNDMLNYLSDTPIARLLKDLSAHSRNSILDRLVMLESLPYVFTPRILYEDVVLSLKKLKINSTMVPSTTFEEFKSGINEIRTKYALDQVVYLSEFDTRLAINLDNDLSLRVLLDYMRKNKECTLTELEPNLLKSDLIQDLDGRNYAGEFVFSMILDGDEKNNNLTLQESRQKYALPYEESVLLPFESGWLYYKFYQVADRENELLHYLLEYADENNLEFFFVRYTDKKGDHLRVRFRFLTSEAALGCLQHISFFLAGLRKKGLFSELEIDTYRREINRYGGKQLMGLVEELFIADSQHVIRLLEDNDLQLETTREYVYVSEILGMLGALSSSLDDALDTMHSIWIGKSPYRSEFRQKEKQFTDLARNAFFGKSTHFAHTTPELSRKTAALSAIREAIVDLSGSGLLTCNCYLSN